MLDVTNTNRKYHIYVLQDLIFNIFSAKYKQVINCLIHVMQHLTTKPRMSLTLSLRLSHQAVIDTKPTVSKRPIHAFFASKSPYSNGYDVGL